MNGKSVCGLIAIGLLVWTVGARGFTPWQSYVLPADATQAAITQDLQGFIWIGGMGKVYRFDGYTFTPYFLPDDTACQVRSLSAPDRNGRIWVGCEGGEVFRGNDSGWERVAGLGLRSPVVEIAFDSAGSVFVATYGEGLYGAQAENDTFISFGTAKGLPSDDIYDLEIDPRGGVHVATDQGIGRCYFEKGERRVSWGKEGLPDPLVVALAQHRSGALWAGTHDRGLFACRAPYGAWEKVENPTASVRQLAAFGAQIWLRDGSGKLYTAYPENSKCAFLPIELPTNSQHFFIDRNSRIWVTGTDNTLYVALTGIRTFDLPETPQALACDPGGNVWIGTATGVISFSPWENSLREGYRGMNTAALYPSGDSSLWIGTLGQGLWRLLPKAGKPGKVSLAGLSPKVPILSIIGTENELWLGTFDGLYAVAAGTSSRAQFLTDVAGNKVSYVYQLHRSHRHTLTAGTDDRGLVFVEGGKLRLGDRSVGIYSHAPAHDADLVYALDETGQLLSYSYSHEVDTLLRTPRSDFTGLAYLGDGRLLLIAENQLLLYDHAQEMLTPFFSWSAEAAGSATLNVVARDTTRNWWWVGLGNQLVHVDAKSLPSSQLPPLRLTEILVNLSSVDSLPDKLSHNQRHLSFTYVAPTFAPEGAVQYRHRLVGYDLDWLSGMGRTAVYPRLAPGNYVFEYQASYDPDFERAASKRLAFRIKKPFWETGIFWVLLVAVIALGGYWVVRQRELRLRRKEEMERLIAKSQFETLRSQINPHFLFNAFSTLSELIEASQEGAIAYVDQLSVMFRNVLAYRDTPLITLEEDLALLAPYHHLQRERFGENFVLHFDIPDALLSRRIPPMTLQMLVENALKHNKISDALPLPIEIRAFDDKLQVRNPLRPRQTSPASTQTGLSNIRLRYKLLTERPIEVSESGDYFEVTLPLLD